MHVFEITVRGDTFKVESYLVETSKLIPSPRSRVPSPVESTAMAAALRAAGYRVLHLELDYTFSIRNGWGKTLGEEAKGLLHHSEPDSRTRVCTTDIGQEIIIKE